MPKTPNIDRFFYVGTKNCVNNTNEIYNKKYHASIVQKTDEKNS